MSGKDITFEHVVSENAEPCIICRQETNYIEIVFEAYVCRDRCLARLEAEYWTALEK